MKLTLRRAFRRRLLGAVGAAAALALVVGCSNAPSGPVDEDGDSLTMLLDSLGDTWVVNNGSTSPYQGMVWGHTTDKLVNVDLDGNITPWIAESWEQNDDATEFTLHLKEGVTFSDGEKLDAAAVVANLDSWAFGRPDEGINPVGLFPKTYEQATAVDARTVKVEFSAPTLGFIPTLGYHASILISPKMIAMSPEEQGNLDNLIGSGPYVVEDWQDGDFVTIKKRDDYDWGPEAYRPDGPAKIDEITFKVVSESSTRAGALYAGQTDVAFNIPPKQLQGFRDAGFRIDLPQYIGVTESIRLNTQQAPFDDINVRKAVQIGIDRDEILDTIYTDGWNPARSVLQSNVPEEVDLTDQLAYDPDEAERLLEESGWKLGDDGIRYKDGEPLTFTLTPNPYLITAEPLDELISQQLKRIGFDVPIEVYDVVTYGERVTADLDRSNWEISRSFVDAGTLASVLTDQNNGEDWFRLGSTDETLNRLQDQIAGATDLDTRAGYLAELQEYLIDQAYYIPRTQMVQRIYAETPYLTGVHYNAIGMPDYSVASFDGDPDEVGVDNRDSGAADDAAGGSDDAAQTDSQAPAREENTETEDER